MRVITGTAKGRRLVTPEGIDVRPTTERVKEAIFSIIQFDVEGRRVLDLFAGSGQLGIEALSRGAVNAVFVESSGSAVEIIKQNLELTSLAGNAKVMNTDVFNFLSVTREKFDLCFLDPPYDKGYAARALPLLGPLMADGAFIICETRAEEILPRDAGLLKIHKTYKYSDTVITIYSATNNR